MNMLTIFDKFYIDFSKIKALYLKPTPFFHFHQTHRHLFLAGKHDTQRRRIKHTTTVKTHNTLSQHFTHNHHHRDPNHQLPRHQ